MACGLSGVAERKALYVLGVGKAGHDSRLSTLSYTQQQAFGAGRGRGAFNMRKGELGNMNRRVGLCKGGSGQPDGHFLLLF